MKERKNANSLIRAAVCLLIMVLSIMVAAPIASKPQTYNKTIQKLDEKQKVVMEVTAVATVSSIGLAAIPDDSTTPVANKIMDLAGYLILVLCAIVMEKYLLTISGFLVFHWFVPIACALAGLNTFLRNKTIAKVTAKILILSVALITVVPISVSLSNRIDETYQVSMALSDSEELPLETEEESRETEEETQAVESEAAKTEENGGWLSRTLNNLADSLASAKESSKEMAAAAVEAAQSAAGTVTKLTDTVISNAQDTLWDLVETVVVLIVTNCIIPILVLIFLLWAINLVLGIQISMPEPGRFTRKKHAKMPDEI